MLYTPGVPGGNETLWYIGGAVIAVGGVSLALWGGWAADRGGRRRPRCRRCWYDLSAQLERADGGGGAPVCPECGRRVNLAKRKKLYRSRRRLSLVAAGALLVIAGAAALATPAIEGHLGWRNLGESYALVAGLPWVPEPERQQALLDLASDPSKRWRGQSWMLARRLASAIGSDVTGDSTRAGAIDLFVLARDHMSVAEQKRIEHAIVRAASDPLYSIRAKALEALRDSAFLKGVHPELAPPVRRAIDDRDPTTAALAAGLISRTGIAPDEAVVCLRACLAHPDAAVRDAAVLALRNYPGASAQAIGDLVRIDGIAALRTIESMGEEAGGAAPGLVAALADAPEETWAELARAIVRIDPTAAHSLDAAVALLESSDLEAVRRGAELLGAWGGHALPARERLVATRDAAAASAEGATPTEASQLRQIRNAADRALRAIERDGG